MVRGGASFTNARSGHQRFSGQARVNAPDALQLPLLSFGTLGAQAVWSIDMAFAPPYLLELGLSKSAMAAVFVAGPLSGLIVQPLIGALADQNTSRHGRRRPFLAVSTLICAIAVGLLGFSREVAAVFTTSESLAHSKLSIGLAVASVYLVDFSVNAVNALNRALMVDVASIEDQAAANAWAARLSGCGGVLSFLIGNLDLPSITPSFLGTTQIQIISVITALLLIVTHAITLYVVQEQVLLCSDAGRNRSKCGPIRLIGDLLRQAKQLPAPIIEVFKIQFFAWIGWFPVLFYSTVWVSEIFRSERVGPAQTKTELFEEATRAGSRAMFWHALIALLTSILLPLVVPSPLGETSHTAVPSFLTSLRKLKSRSPDLPFWWVFSQFIFFSAMMGTWVADLAQSVFFASLLIASVGFCWAVTNWIPFGLLGILIQQGSEAVETHVMTETTGDLATEALLGSTSSRRGSREESGGSGDDSDDVENVLSFGPHSATDGDVSHAANGGTSGHAGSVLGLHNLAIVIPQFVVTIVSSAIFAFMEPGESTPAAHGAAVAPKPGGAVGIVFRLGGVSAFVAGVLAIRFVRRYGAMLSA